MRSATMETWRHCYSNMLGDAGSIVSIPKLAAKLTRQLSRLHNLHPSPDVLDQPHAVRASSLGVGVVYHRRLGLHQELAIGTPKFVRAGGAVFWDIRVGESAGGILAVCGARGGGRLQPASSLLFVFLPLFGVVVAVVVVLPASLSSLLLFPLDMVVWVPLVVLLLSMPYTAQGTPPWGHTCSSGGTTTTGAICSSPQNR